MPKKPTKKEPTAAKSLDGLGELQGAVMETIWSLGEATVQQVRDELTKSKTLAYTTVLSAMQKLEKAGWLDHRGARTYVYFPLQTRAEAAGSALAHFTRRVFRGEPLLLFQHLLDDGKLADADLAELRKNIDRRRKDAAMNELSAWLPGTLCSVVWQSTLCLAIGGLVSQSWHRRPARAAGVLSAAMLATLAAPFLTLLFHHSGWGLLAPAQSDFATGASTSARPVLLSDSIEREAADDSLAGRTENGVASETVVSAGLASTTQSPASTDSAARLAAGGGATRSGVLGTGRFTLRWTSLWPVLGACWLAASLIALVRLAMSFWSGLRLIARSQPLNDCADGRRIGRIGAAVGSRASSGGPHIRADLLPSGLVLVCASR